MTDTQEIEVLPIVNDHVVAGFDVGGTKTAVRFYNRRSENLIFSNTYQSSRFRSLVDLIAYACRMAGVRPGKLVLAIAGPRQANGNVQITNIDWPEFSAEHAQTALGIPHIETVNDMMATAAGLATWDLSQATPYRTGRLVLGAPKQVVAVSTGIGDAQILADGTAVESEAGHSTWQPLTKQEYDYLTYLRDVYDVDAITVEVAASGGQGFYNLYNFLHTQRLSPSAEVVDKVGELLAAGHGIGPAITAGALQGDQFCLDAMQILGSILGQHIRNRTVATLSTGGVILTGGVVQDPDVANLLMYRTPLMRRFVSERTQHWLLLHPIQIYVNNDPEVAVKGALELAKR